MKTSILILPLIMIASAVPALAEIHDVKAPTLEFQTIPFESTRLKEHKVLPYRFYNKMIVSVWDPVLCGQKATDPKVAIQGNKLILNYSLTKAPQNAGECALVSEFQIDNVPNKDLEVYFAGGHEPYIVASMKNCSFYKPFSEERWDCLIPAN